MTAETIAAGTTKSKDGTTETVGSAVCSMVKGVPSTKLPVRTSRIVFVICLAAVAGCLAFASYRLLRDAERKLAREQFASVADRALDSALEITLRKRLGAKSLAMLASQTFPDAAIWPYVNIRGFEAISKSVMDIADAATMGLCPRVRPDELDRFVDYAYDSVFKENNYPNTTGYWHGVGKAVHSFYQLDNGTYVKYPEVNGTTVTWNSTTNDIWPFLMHSAGHIVLMWNVHSLQWLGEVIDELVHCTENHRTPSEELDLTECAILSDFFVGYSENAEPVGLSAIIMQPIYPANDPNELTGIVTSSMRWDEVLGNLFASEVSGIDIVLRTETQSATYYVQNGNATIKGTGDLHDTFYESYGQSIDLYGASHPGLFSYTSAKYTLTLYPRDELFVVYSTSNPWVALGGSLGIVLFTSVLFFLYDFFVRREFHHKQAIMDAKRRYVRFISHEVRTPLNAIVMGSRLVQDDMIAFSRQQTQQQEQEQEQRANTITSTTTNAETKTGEDDDVPVQVPVDGDDDDDSRGEGELLKRKLDDWTGLTGDILNSAQSAVGVLNDILSYDKVETGTLQLQLTIVNIWALIKRTSTEFTLPAIAKDINLTIDFSSLVESSSNTHCEEEDEESPHVDLSIELSKESPADILPPHVAEQHVVGDSVRIAQILRNFLSNAVKFTPAKGDISVIVRWLQPPADSSPAKAKQEKTFVLERGNEITVAQNGCVRVDVTDSGAGLTKEQLSEIFGEGVQFDVNRLQAGQGSGLGLYIARGIAEQHGGHLSVASRGAGRGSTFSMTLPLYHVPDDMLPDNLKRKRKVKVGTTAGVSNEQMESIVPPSGNDNDNPMNSSGFRILVVDDTFLNRKMLVRLLAKKGHVCDQAENGQVAVELIQNAIDEGKPYVTVLLDYEMPVMDGPTAAKKMRKLGCDSCIVGVTGNLLPEDISIFKQHGANCVLPKPLDLNDLEDMWVEYGILGDEHD